MPFLRTCEWCSADFEARRASARYCCAAHRTAAYRARGRASADEAERAAADVTAERERERTAMPLTAATVDELRAAGVDATALGQGAIVLATRIDRFSPLDPPSALAGLVKEHAAAMMRAKGGVEVDTLDPFDELARRREERRKAAGG